MTSFRLSAFNLLKICLIFSMDCTKSCSDNVSRPPEVTISPLSEKQSLTVSWKVDYKGSLQNFYEIQISRTENYNIIYNKNISVSSGESMSYTWISDVPLECVSHSVRIRLLCDGSAPSPWSNWKTNSGVEAVGRLKMFPKDRVLRAGSSQMFCCVPPPGVNISGMTFMNDNWNLLSLGERVKAIVVDSLPLTFADETLDTWLIGCSGMKPARSIWNYVGLPPQKPRNLKCATSDLLKVDCTWVSDGNVGSRHNEQTQTLHVENSNQNPISCGKSSCTFPVVPQLQQYDIRVVVRNKVGEEMESYSFNISERVSPVVMWDRIKPGVTNASLSWFIKENLTQTGLFCQVATLPDSRTQLNCSVGLCGVLLGNLLPNKHYSTKVRCSVDGRFWGNWAETRHFKTDPLVTLDLWRKIEPLLDSNNRTVTLMWKPVSSGTAAGVNILGFRVQWSEEGENRTDLKLDSEARQIKVSVGPGKSRFTVQALLHSGSSIPDHCTIPPAGPEEIASVQKRVSSTTAGGLSLFWEDSSSLTCSFTVEWCMLGDIDPCSLTWMKVPRGNKTLFIPAGYFLAGRRYSFNIHGCSSSGGRLLETHTGYSEELKPVQLPSLVDPVHSSSSSVTLEWSYNEEDPAEPAFISGYLVTWQEIRSGATNEKNSLMEKYVSDPHTKHVTIEGLQEDEEYTFSVRAFAKVGPGPPVRVTVRTKINYSARLVKVLTPIFFLLGSIILLFSQRKLLKEVLVYPSGMNIKTPELDSFLDETDQKLQAEKAEECFSCAIEIVTFETPLSESTTLREPPDSQSSNVTLQENFTPPSSDPLGAKQALDFTNESYLLLLKSPKPSFESSDYL